MSFKDSAGTIVDAVDLRLATEGTIGTSSDTTQHQPLAASVAGVVENLHPGVELRRAVEHFHRISGFNVPVVGSHVGHDRNRGGVEPLPERDWVTGGYCVGGDTVLRFQIPHLKVCTTAESKNLRRWAHNGRLSILDVVAFAALVVQVSDCERCLTVRLDISNADEAVGLKRQCLE